MERINKKELIDFEERINDLYKKSKIRAPVHLSKGNENQLIDIFKNVNDDDWVFSNWRNHYHALLKGIPPKELEDEILSGRSMYIASKKNKFFSSSLVGGHLPIALGTAMALKLKGLNNHVWTFLGDMAAETGVFHESTKYAEGHKLPITFVVEDNGLSVYTPTKKVWGKSIFTNNTKELRAYNFSQLREIIDEEDSSKIKRYGYQRQWPHHGVGLWVEFSDDKGAEVDIRKKYQERLKEAMNFLSKDERILFLGQTVRFKGSPIYNSLEDIAYERRVELPVMEEVQMGMSIGLALEDYIPLTIFPRFDFLTLATNQLVNHLDKMIELSHGQFNPKVIVRTAIGSKFPLYPGPQHCQDHTEAYRLMLKNTDVVKLENPEDILPAYNQALKKDISTLLVEKS